MGKVTGLGVVVAALGLVGACTITTKEKTPPADDLLAPPAKGEGVQFRMVSSLEPGQEIERCQVFVAPPEGLNIQREEVRYSPGSHHVLLFTTSYKTPPTTKNDGTPIPADGPVDCPEGASADFDVTGVVGGAQSANAPPIVDLPEGVALKVPGNAVLIMNTHYLNPTGMKLDTDARVNAYTIPDAEVTDEAGILFWYDYFIHAPTNASSSARMACPIDRDIHLVNAQSHMHKRGVSYTANLIDPAGATSPIYSSDSWENVPVTQYEDTIVKAGSKIDYQCNYQNTEDHDIYQGLTTKDEMCMFIALYYPRDIGTEYCAKDGGDFSALSSAATFMGHGAKTCNDFLSCILPIDVSTPDGFDAYQSCVADTCPKAGEAMTGIIDCQFSNAYGACDDACNDGGDCTSCLVTACDPEIKACGAATCG